MLRGPGFVVGAEEARRELFGEGRGYASEMGAEGRCRDSVLVESRGSIEGPESVYGIECSCVNGL